MVGGSAAALYARHRDSFDRHDHVLADLSTRYEQILEAVEATDGRVTSVRASRQPFTLMGSLGGVEAGLRQLRRTRPLEVTEVEVPDAGRLRIPTDAEMLRVKSYLVVQHNHVRDYLDTVALCETRATAKSRASSAPTRARPALAQMGDRRCRMRAARGRDPGEAPMTTMFRNVEGSPTMPVEQWPYEALVATIERGTLREWLPLIREIERSPWGTVARHVDAYLGYASPYGVGPLLRRTISRARTAAEAHEREVVANRVRSLIRLSGLSNEEFARAIGTSRSRLSTYASGKVVPAATLLVRMASVARCDGRGRVGAR
ncbi:MAG: helix-turn-helix domain-containing protein [Solirubrobacteraceae bacterium]